MISNRSIDTWNIVLMADRTVDEFVDQLVIGNRKSITISKEKFSLKRYILYFVMQHDTSKELLRLYSKLTKEISQKKVYTDSEFDEMVDTITIAFGKSLLMSKTMSMTIGQLMASPNRKKKLDADYDALTGKIKEKLCTIEELYNAGLLCKLASPLFRQLARTPSSKPRRRYSKAYNHFLERIYPNVLSSIRSITTHYILDYYMPPYTGPVISMEPGKLVDHVLNAHVIPTSFAEVDLVTNILSEMKVSVIRGLRNTSQPRRAIPKPVRFKIQK